MFVCSGTGGAAVEQRAACSVESAQPHQYSNFAGFQPHAAPLSTPPPTPYTQYPPGVPTPWPVAPFNGWFAPPPPRHMGRAPQRYFTPPQHYAPPFIATPVSQSEAEAHFWHGAGANQTGRLPATPPVTKNLSRLSIGETPKSSLGANVFSTDQQQGTRLNTVFRSNPCV